jgi:hypothetical protein
MHPARDGVVMAAKKGPPGLRRLMERARGRDTLAAGRRGDAGGPWAGRYAGLDPDYGLYTEYADPLAEADHEFMTEAREIMGLDPDPGY